MGGVAGIQWGGGKKGKKRKREKEGGTFRVPGELLFRTRVEAQAHLREALREEDDGDDRDDGDNEGDEGDGHAIYGTRGNNPNNGKQSSTNGNVGSSWNQRQVVELRIHDVHSYLVMVFLNDIPH